MISPVPEVWKLLSAWIRPGGRGAERAAVYVFHSLVAARWRK